MEFETSALDDMLHDLHIDNVLVTVLLTTFAPLLIRTIIYFFTVTWPNFIHFLVVKLILRREVIGAPMNLDKTEETYKKWIHNDLLVHMLLTYVSHRLQERHSLLQQKLSSHQIQNGKREHHSQEQQKIITSAIIDESNLAPPLFAQLELKPSPFKFRKPANYCEVQKPNEETIQGNKGDKLDSNELTPMPNEQEPQIERNNVHGKMGEYQEELHYKKNGNTVQRESSVNGKTLSQEGSSIVEGQCEMKKMTLGVNPVLRNILLNEYTISTVPAFGIAVEVEPGLFVRYIESKTSWSKFIHKSLSGTHNQNSGTGDGNNNGNPWENTSNNLNAKAHNNRTMERGATIRETYLLYDLLQKLRFWPRGYCSDNKTDNAATKNGVFNNAGPFGNNVENSWWSKMFTVNFAWNSFLLGWFGVSGKDGDDKSENWNDDDDDDDDEVRALEEEQKQGYIARQIMIESVRLQPVSVQDHVHHPILQSL